MSLMLAKVSQTAARGKTAKTHILITAASQRRMAWVAIGSMCVFAILPVIPFIPPDRLSTLASLSDMLFLSQASIVGLYFGATAYMAKR